MPASVERTQLDSTAVLHKWTLGASEAGDWVLSGHYNDKSVHVVPAGGASIVIEGTNDPAQGNPVTLNDAQGTALSAITADRLRQVLENPLFMRPKNTAGAGSATVFLLLSSAR